MPPTLTWKQLLWTGIVLTVVGLVARLYLVPLAFALWGDAGLNNPALHWTQAVLGHVAFQIGLALIAFLLVIRALERSGLPDGAPTNGAVDKGAVSSAAPAPAPRTLVRVFWIGVVLVVLGLILQESLVQWEFDLLGAVDVAGGIARDILWLVGAPLEAVAMPLGVLLTTGAVAARTLESAFIRPRVS
ncbi:hypothetical protein [Homoserinimonas hongtaonis]|uniref:hypothetical protein n=1 Tax=Homoserinimonas hongtaonis TaxID=2079791 RepID=UPI000D337AD9|nr:hypothetical protein [Salinibacterium hongtaonis]AWB88219.1 hypothetical protein C2138_00460 [Salinibacterium hongtaonis]